MNELKKEILSDKAYHITNDFNDEELDYFIKICEFIKEERKRQDEEIKEN